MRILGDRVATVALLSISAVTGPSIFWFWRREMFHRLAVYHVFDIPERLVPWLAIFHWYALGLPLVWFASIVLIVFELGRRRRLAIIAVYVALPIIFAALYWGAWQVYIFVVSRQPSA